MKNVSFEEAMKKLEKIAGELEIGELSLEESFNKFKEGMELSGICSKKLEEFEKKITILVQEKEGNYSEKPFEINNVSDSD